MAVRVTGHPLIVFAVIVAVPVIGDLRFKLGVSLCLGQSQGDRIVRR
ncbi:hypothetical protein [Brucella intermedia]|nr:hypothetical protein [Brucella intermedia]